MQALNAADWTVIVVYLAGIISFGANVGKKQQNTRDYFLGSRAIPWWGVGLSIVASETSALTFIAVPAIAYGGDLSFLQIVLGYVLARIVLAIFLVPHYFAGEIYSPYQLLKQSFGEPARRTVGLLYLMAGSLAAGVRVYVTCIPIQLIMGLPQAGIFWAMLLFVGLSLIYTFIGGVKAVIWVDAVQFGLFAAGGIYSLFYIPGLIEGGMGAALREAAAAGKLQWFNPHFSWALAGSPPFNIWMGIFGATVQVMASHGADQLVVQRVLTCRSVAEGRKSLILSAVIIAPLLGMFLLTGAMLWVYYRHFPNFPVPVPEVRPGVAKNDYIFPIFIVTRIPHVFKGLLIVAILSAAMSSVSSAMSALASVLTMDFFRPLCGQQKSEKFYLRFSRYSTALWAVVLILIALATQHVASVLNLAFKLSGLTSGALLGGITLAVLWPPGSSWPVVMGMLGSVAVMVAISTFLGQRIGWPWYTLIGTAATWTIATGSRWLLPRGNVT